MTQHLSNMAYRSAWSALYGHLFLECSKETYDFGEATAILQMQKDREESFMPSKWSLAD